MKRKLAKYFSSSSNYMIKTVLQFEVFLNYSLKIVPEGQYIGKIKE